MGRKEKTVKRYAYSPFIEPQPIKKRPRIIPERHFKNTLPSNSAQPGPSKSPQPGPSKSSQPGPWKSPQLGPSKSPQLGPSKSPQPGPSKSPQPGPWKSPQPGPSKSPQPGPSKSSQPGPSKSPQPGPSKSSQPGRSKSPQPGPSNLAAKNDTPSEKKPEEATTSIEKPIPFKCSFYGAQDETPEIKIKQEKEDVTDFYGAQDVIPEIKIKQEKEDVSGAQDIAPKTIRTYMKGRRGAKNKAPIQKTNDKQVEEKRVPFSTWVKSNLEGLPIGNEMNKACMSGGKELAPALVKEQTSNISDSFRHTSAAAISQAVALASEMPALPRAISPPIQPILPSTSGSMPAGGEVELWQPNTGSLADEKEMSYMRFFLSLWYDIKPMTNAQFRGFKRTVMNAIEDSLKTDLVASEQKK